jgi:hypothetical protein
MARDLVEKVARRLARLYFDETQPDIDERFPSVEQYTEEKWREFADEAHVAIKAVAAWIGPEYCVTQGNLLKQLKETASEQ